jgi:dihydrofolate synthase/folylpolyglutamate synthase
VSTIDPLEFLFSLERLGMKFGLGNMQALCAALDHPERAFRPVIVAGTNGKGSVTVLTETALRAAGHRTARYTSPHLVRLEERFVIDGMEAATGDVRRAAAAVQGVAERLVRDGHLEGLPTFFECTTAVAFELFRRARVEIGVLEVGLGGRLDATNVVTPIAAAITSIDRDHEAQLGSTLGSIAREKAGVARPDIAVVCGPLEPEAEQAVAAVCAERGSRLVRALDRVQITWQGPPSALILHVRTPRRVLDGVPLALAGVHQAANAAVAVALLETLEDAGIEVPDDAIRAGLSQARWPGRLERFERSGREVLVDAAHNPAGARALAAHLRGIGWHHVTLLIGVMRDKDAASMLAPLLPLSDSVVCTTAPSPRALPADELAALVRRAPGAPRRVEAVADPAAALGRAMADDRPIVAAGSIFLIGPLRDILR